jgi:hypothetical protein
LEPGRCPTFELNRPSARWRLILLEDEERGDARPPVRVSVQQVKDPPQDAIAAALFWR